MLRYVIWAVIVSWRGPHDAAWCAAWLGARAAGHAAEPQPQREWCAPDCCLHRTFPRPESLCHALCQPLPVCAVVAGSARIMPAALRQQAFEDPKTQQLRMRELLAIRQVEPCAPVVRSLAGCCQGSSRGLAAWLVCRVQGCHCSGMLERNLNPRHKPRAASGKPGASLEGVTMVDGSGDTSVDDLMRGMLANATVASTFASPRFSYTPVGDDRGAWRPAAWGQGKD